MKRPLLKILPGVAVVLISTSCNKDGDYIAEDNTALVAEQIIENQVFYLKIHNASSLSKMTVEGLGKEGEKVLKFEIGDQLTIAFDVIAKISDSGAAEEIGGVGSVTISATATCTDSENGIFKVELKGFTCSLGFSEIHWNESAKIALQEMQDGVSGAASKYNVQLTWGSQLDFSSEKYYGYDNLSEMFAAAPRSADNSFTLQQNGDYCFVVFEEGCNKIVTVDGSSEPLDRSKCYIVKSGTNITVEGAFFNTITTESGNFYYVRKQAEAEDGSGDLDNPNPGNVQRVDL